MTLFEVSTACAAVAEHISPRGVEDILGRTEPLTNIASVV
jgi:hypothetical protein